LNAGDRCYERTAPTLSDWKLGYVYGRVLDVPAGTPSPAGISVAARYLVRYWLFYAFDDWRSRDERLWQAHEADWESVSVALDDSLHPIFAAYSQHCSGTVRAWAKAHRSGTHPVDYVALGSHANYFDKKSSPTQFLRCVYKNVANADRTSKRVVPRRHVRSLSQRSRSTAQSGRRGSSVTPRRWSRRRGERSMRTRQQTKLQTNHTPPTETRGLCDRLDNLRSDHSLVPAAARQADCNLKQTSSRREQL